MVYEIEERLRAQLHGMRAKKEARVLLLFILPKLGLWVKVLYSAVPHSMADERMMVTHPNSWTTQNETNLMTLRLLQPRKPIIRLFDIERLLRTIDDDNLDTKAKANYDESDDEENTIITTRKGRGSELTSKIHSQPLIGDENINTAVEEPQTDQ
jgi:hypothetical protein